MVTEVIFPVKQKLKVVHIIFYCMLCSEDTFRRLSALSPHRVAEVCEQANTVAVELQLAADELRTTRQSSAAVDSAEDANGTLDEIKCPEFMEIDDLEHSPDLRSAVAVRVTEAVASSPLPAKSQTKGKGVSVVKRSSTSAVKENMAPTSAALPSTGRKVSSGVSKACH